MKPKTYQEVIFRTKDGLIKVGHYFPRSNKWAWDSEKPMLYDSDVVEWWPLPEDNTGNKNN